MALALALDSSGSPSGYAGAALGQAMGMLFMLVLAMAAGVGLIVGAAFLRRKRGLLVEWGAMLACLAVCIALPLCLILLFY